MLFWYVRDVILIPTFLAYVIQFNSIQNYFIVTYHVQMDKTKSQKLYKSSSMTYVMTLLTIL